ncbi:DUF292-domain-containing protein [Crucibulum laeve]|uniref:DUF292-domain-containing protein n=1 Tax=Crucibulum laeve TaxID=68775 RepID=A0A5C3MBW0_9AGAR|nr:DUF292-domain-containing protein [Crucibulum laeve]
MPPWNSAKAKVQLRLSVQRLRTLQQKKEAQAKASRRDIATLLERGKVETARVKVETIINEDIHVELLELLELYCELLLARFGLLDQNTREPDPGITEGVCSIIHAAPRTELKELHILRDILMHKYGREFSLAVMENRDGCVSDRVVRKISNATPSSELVDAYLSEIAKAYAVKWSPPGTSDNSSPPDGGAKEPVDEAKEDQSSQSPVPDAQKESAASPAPVLPTVPPTENKKEVQETKTKTAGTKDLADEPADEFDVLAKRFAALKKR